MEYQIAFVKTDGEFDVVAEIDCDTDGDANDEAESRYPGQEWYVLRDGHNVNA